MLTPINPNKTVTSIPDRVVTQKADFNSFLMEIKHQQLDAMSGFLGSEKGADPLAGYQRALLDSLASQIPAGASEKVVVILADCVGSRHIGSGRFQTAYLVMHSGCRRAMSDKVVRVGNPCP